MFDFQAYSKSLPAIELSDSDLMAQCFYHAYDCVSILCAQKARKMLPATDAAKLPDIQLPTNVIAFAQACGHASRHIAANGIRKLPIIQDSLLTIVPSLENAATEVDDRIALRQLIEYVLSPIIGIVGMEHLPTLRPYEVKAK